MKRGHLNCSVDIRYSIVAFNMSLVIVKLQLGLPYRNIWINWSLPWDKICLLAFLMVISILKGLPRSVETWAVEKKVIVSVLLQQSHNGFRVSWKQCETLRATLKKYFVNHALVCWCLVPVFGFDIPPVYDSNSNFYYKNGFKWFLAQSLNSVLLKNF